MRATGRTVLSVGVSVGLACVYASAYVFPLLSTTQAYFLPSLWSYVVWPALVAVAVVAAILVASSRLLDRYAGPRTSVAAQVALSGVLTLLALKAALDAADLSWIHILSLLTTAHLPGLRAAMVALTATSLAVLCITSFMFRRRVGEWLRFLATLGFAFAILAAVRVAGYAPREAVAGVPAQPLSVAARHAGIAAARRVVWVIFDELDYGVTLGDPAMRPRIPHFTALEAQGVSAVQAYPPAATTKESIPALLMGELVTDARVGPPGRLRLARAGAPALAFGLDGSVFGRIPAGAGSASILGFYHPYCRVFDTLGACSSHFLGNAGRWFDGLTFFAQALFSAGRWVRGFVDATPHALWSRFDPMFATTEKLVDALPAALGRDSDALTFIHLSVPHVPGGYAQKVLGLPQTADDRESYDGNVLLADRLLGSIVETLAARHGSREVLLIVTSDHWLRLESPSAARPIPFIAWRVGERNGTRMDRPINTVHTASLVVDFLSGSVTSQSDIAQWWRAKPFQPTSTVRGNEY